MFTHVFIEIAHFTDIRFFKWVDVNNCFNIPLGPFEIHYLQK